MRLLPGWGSRGYHGFVTQFGSCLIAKLFCEWLPQSHLVFSSVRKVTCLSHYLLAILLSVYLPSSFSGCLHPCTGPASLSNGVVHKTQEIICFMKSIVRVLFPGKQDFNRLISIASDVPCKDHINATFESDLKNLWMVKTNFLFSESFHLIRFSGKRVKLCKFWNEARSNVISAWSRAYLKNSHRACSINSAICYSMAGQTYIHKLCGEIAKLKICGKGNIQSIPRFHKWNIKVKKEMMFSFIKSF